MLILTRRIGESIIIGNNVVVNVLGVRGLQVRLGIEAPREVSVHREEIYRRILKELQNGGEQSAPGLYADATGFDKPLDSIDDDK